MTWSWDSHRVIGPTEQDALRRPIDKFWDVSHGALCKVISCVRFFISLLETPVL
jgi:hypothetical protein